MKSTVKNENVNSVNISKKTKVYHNGKEILSFKEIKINASELNKFELANGIEAFKRMLMEKCGFVPIYDDDGNFICYKI